MMQTVEAWSTITAAEVRPTALAFHRVHPECGMVVHIERGQCSLVCWCERCQNLRAYEIDKDLAHRPQRNAASVERNHERRW